MLLPGVRSRVAEYEDVMCTKQKCSCVDTPPATSAASSMFDGSEAAKEAVGGASPSPGSKPALALPGVRSRAAEYLSPGKEDSGSNSKGGVDGASLMLPGVRSRTATPAVVDSNSGESTRRNRDCESEPGLGLMLPGVRKRTRTRTSSGTMFERQPGQRSRSSTCESPRLMIGKTMSKESTGVTFRQRISYVDITPVNLVVVTRDPWVNIRREDFTAIKYLGAGGFGEVKLVRYDLDGQLYAMKSIEKGFLNERRYVSKESDVTKGPVSERDFGIAAKEWQCPFIVELHATFQTTAKLHYIYEFCPGGELYDLLRAQPEGKFQEEQARFYLAEIVLALSHLHDNEVIHRDVKLENILLGQDGHVRLADFGSVRAELPRHGSRSFVDSSSPAIFMPPEFLRGEAYGKELDCWQLGVAAFAMFTGGYPPARRKEPKPPEMPAETPELAQALCNGLLAPERNRRLGHPDGARLVRNHAFFEQLDWISLESRITDPPFMFEEDDEDPDRDLVVRMRGSLRPDGSCLDLLRMRNWTWAAGDDDASDTQSETEDTESSSAVCEEP